MPVHHPLNVYREHVAPKNSLHNRRRYCNANYSDSSKSSPPSFGAHHSRLAGNIFEISCVAMHTIQSTFALAFCFPYPHAHEAQTTHYAARFIEILLILATHLPPGPLAQYILIFNNATAQKIRITPIFLLGILLSVFGTVLRMKSYRTLGRLFTFELCIRKDHVLIVTGPYSVIRHPSYIGLIMTIIGECCSQLHGSWVKECGIADTLRGQVLIGIWLWIAWAVVASLLLRIPIEDKLLHTAFGTEWEAWASRVQYKLIPLVY